MCGYHLCAWRSLVFLSSAQRAHWEAVTWLGGGQLHFRRPMQIDLMAALRAE
jgi:hypothetical protein